MSDCDCDTCLGLDDDDFPGLILPGLPPRALEEILPRPAADRAAERWQLDRPRRTHPCGCVSVQAAGGGVLWKTYSCKGHRLT